MFNGLYPAINRSSAAITSATEKINDRIESRIDIIEVINDGTEVYVWIKNVGTSEIAAIERSDVFYGPENNFDRIPYGASGPPVPYWNYTIEGGYSQWGQATTLKITIYLASPPTTGTYMVKIVIPNGISDETTFGV